MIRPLPYLHPFVFFIMAQVVSLSASLSASSQASPAPHKMEYWLGAIPPVVQRDPHKAIPSDYNKLFSEPDEFPVMGGRITSFNVATQFVLRGTPEEQYSTFSWIRAHHLKLSLDAGVVVQ